MKALSTKTQTSEDAPLPDGLSEAASEYSYLFHYASEYLDRGFSVIPLSGKRPALASWKEYQDRRPTLGEIIHWFGNHANGAAQHNIGIVTGKVSDLVVIDCDNRKSAVWWYKNRPRTDAMIKTGRGGVHFYYRYGDGSGNRTGVLDRAIDIRGDGGYVVAPPSIHPNGVPYAWVRPLEQISLDRIPLFEGSWIDESEKRFVPTRVTQPRPQSNAMGMGIDYKRFRELVAEAGGIARVLELAAPDWEPLATSNDGTQLRGPCPVHGSAVTSQTFSVNTNKNTFKCFKAKGCEAARGGNAIDLFALLTKQPLYAACHELADSLGIELPLLKDES